MKKLIFNALFCFTFFGCIEEPQLEEFTTTGLSPVYSQLEIGDVLNSNITSLQGLTSFFLTDETIYLLELGKGIHVINNTDVTAPQYETFLEVPGAIGVIPKEETLIINSTKSMITVQDINGTYTVMNVFDKPTTFGEQSLNLPPDYTGFFECLDPEMGIPTTWVEAQLQSPRCQKN